MKTKLLIFGITGDLSTRKLLPALEQIINTGNFNELSVIGVSRREVDTKELFGRCANKGFLDDKLSIFTMDLDAADDYKRLKEFINLGEDEQLLAYMSVPPLATTRIVDLMGSVGMNGENVKVLFEKPFGVDLESAENLMHETSKNFQEEQIYRIDHYMAKEMAQNIVAFRGRNALFNDVWNNKFIDSITITAVQQIGIEGRANFYEQTGALRDIVQGHLMQLLVLTLMDVPPHFEWDRMPELRLEALKSLRPIDPRRVIRAQYASYKQEVNNHNSNVETFVALELQSNQSKWLGVPMKLITGKSIDRTFTEISVHLKSNNGDEGNCLKFRIQPNEGIDMELFVKKPGYSRDFESRHLNFDYSNSKIPDAYEQVIVDAISSHKSLFTTSDEVLRSWEILRPVQESWKDDLSSISIYKNGSTIDSVLA
jgi:glucose-6-phosphate 1-dehydrogenase